MTAIRPLRREDLPQLAALLADLWSGSAPPHLAGFLEQTLFDQPWADPDIPSLVYVDGQGKIVGTIASSTQRMRFDGRPLRVVSTSHFWAHPSVRKRAAGVQLLRMLLAGPQDLTIADATSDAVRRMWETLGGRTAHLSCFSFYRIFRPWRLGSELLLGRRRAAGPLGAALRPVSLVLDGATGRVARRILIPRRPESTTERLTPSAMIEHLPAFTASLRLYPDYEKSYLEWLFERLGEIDQNALPWLRGIERGPVFAELVRRNEQVLGWYVCQLRSAGLCRVMQLAVTDRDADAVLDQLSYRAWEKGAVAVVGRVEPRLVGPLMRLPCFVLPTGRVLIHSREESVVGAILAGDASLTRLDGEWWA